jgi:chemotaxis protein methyltransferase CheR
MSLNVQTSGSSAAQPLSGDLFARVCELIEGRSGLDFAEARRSLLESSLRSRMEETGISAPGSYLERIASMGGGEEFEALLNTLTITETQFLRDPAQFQLLRRHILPAVMSTGGADGERRVRICSAGCASGEEAYSIAMTWRDMDLARESAGWAIEIVGIDVNTAMLDAARRRVYSARAVRNVGEDGLRRYFTPEACGFEFDSGAASLVRFEHASVLDEGALGSDRYHVIFCKNVSIYFRPDLTRRLVQRLHRALMPGGYLLLGHSESLWRMEQGLELVERDGVFCYRKPPSPRLADAPAMARAPEPAEDLDSAESRYEQCLQLLKSADWPRAHSDVAALLHEYEAFVPAHLLMAGIHAHLGRYAEASECAAHALRINSLEPKAHLLLGMIAARAGRPDEAIDALRRALSLDDSLALGYFWLGNLYRDAGNLEAACAEYARAVTRHRHRELDFTEEFAADLEPAQIVDFCRSSLERLRGTW